MSLIRIEDVSFSYLDEKRDGIKNINLSIAKGEFIVLCGESGCGKTTITRLINGLIPNFYEGVMKGQVTIDGKVVSKQPLYDTARLVGSVFQNPRSQFFNVDTNSEIAFGCENFGVSEEEIENRMKSTVEIFNISKLLNRSIFNLSGGEKRRAAIAGIIAMDPEVLILDEPTAGLDPLGKKSLIKQIMDYHKERKNTIIFVSHSMEDVADYVQRLVVMDEGTVRYDGTPEEVFLYYKELEQMGLKAPEVTYLMHELKQRGYRVNENATTIEAAKDSILKVFGR